MKIKSYSMFMGIRDYNARLVQVENHHVLELEGHGQISPLDYIKQGCRVIEATPDELRKLKQAGYSVRVESL